MMKWTFKERAVHAQCKQQGRRGADAGGDRSGRQPCPEGQTQVVLALHQLMTKQRKAEQVGLGSELDRSPTRLRL